MDRCGADEEYLVIFDREEDDLWEKKIFKREETYKGQEIKVWGMQKIGAIPCGRPPSWSPVRGHSATPNRPATGGEA